MKYFAALVLVVEVGILVILLSSPGLMTARAVVSETLAATFVFLTLGAFGALVGALNRDAMNLRAWFRYLFVSVNSLVAIGGVFILQNYMLALAHAVICLSICAKNGAKKIDA
jgi:hypothetical protein